MPVASEAADGPPAPVAPAARLALASPVVAGYSLIGNCSGPPSPGESVRVTASVDYAAEGDQTVTSGVRLVQRAPDSAPRVLTTNSPRSFSVSGAGTLDWTDVVVIPAAAAPGTMLQLSAWAMPSPGLPVHSDPLDLQLGATLMVRVVDDTGADVGAAVSVTNGDCWRTRGATMQGDRGTSVAFYHLDPAGRAEVLATAPGYFPAKASLDPAAGDLSPGMVRDLTITLRPRMNYAALESELQSLVGNFAGLNAVSVMDLQTGRMLSVNGSRQQYAACTVKMLVMFAVAEDIEKGLYTEGDVYDLAVRAMGPSQVWPARELFRITGGGDVGRGVRRANETMWRLGATRSIITHPPGYYWEEYGYGISHNIVENLATTDDMVLLLAKLYRGEVLSPEATEYVLWSMTLGRQFGLAGSLGNPLPWGVTLYQKMGQLDTYDGTWNDIGIVVFERDGREYSYAIAYLGSLAGWPNHHAYGSLLSGATWRAFDAAYSTN